jgi:hypothetical protein
MTSSTRRTRKPKTPTAKGEEAAFIRSLEKHGQAVECEGPLPPGATHRLTVRKSGEKRVKRKRFSAA